MQRQLILGCLLYLAMTSLVLAQTATGVIRGTVQDSTGAVVIDVHVLLIDQARNQRWEQATTEQGSSSSGRCRSAITGSKLDHPGFMKAVIEDVALQVAQTVRFNVTLQVGSVTESITVQSDRGLLETSDASLSQVIDDKRLLELADQRAQRHATRFAVRRRHHRRPCQCHSTPGQLRPGVLGRGAARQHVRGPGRRHGNQRPGAQQLSAGDTSSGLFGRIPCADRELLGGVWREFRSGDQCGVQAGLKRFHATLFEFLRNNALDARNFFSATVDPLKRNQFGFAASGPVFLPGLYNGKDRLFWMFSYEGTRRRQAVTTTTLVPTLKERAGDFSGVPPLSSIPSPKFPFREM